MTTDQRIAALERELVNDRLSSIRLRLFAGVFVIACVVPQFRSIFYSMNVELPAWTKMLLASSVLVEDWGLFLLPALWVWWRMCEDRFLRSGSPVRARVVRHAITVGLALIAFSLYMPFLTICNNVG